jgi:hypothetical protein
MNTHPFINDPTLIKRKEDAYDYTFEERLVDSAYSYETKVKEFLKDSVWLMVIEDMKARNKLGFHKYGKFLTVDSEDDMLNHAYEEALDLAVYLKTEILKRNMK